MPGHKKTESAASPDASKTGRQSEPHSKLQCPPQPQDQGTDQLSRNKEAQDVTNQILALVDERAYLLSMPKPSHEAKAGIIAGLDNITFLNETLAKKDAAEEALESDARKMMKKLRAQNSKYAKLLAEEKAMDKSTNRQLETLKGLLERRVEHLEKQLEQAPRRGMTMVMKILVSMVTLMLVCVSYLLQCCTEYQLSRPESELQCTG
ncbi:MAG: hypothetical protein LQ346_003177 [Caloplaca aetnensis]|nr:MAG: hypothetical protein LQ346_003177 [Caloplaca aetnensis]